MGFTLARLEVCKAQRGILLSSLIAMQYLSFYGVFCNPSITGANGASPGECYYYMRNPFKVGIMLHLYCILPAAFLVCFQFVPAIRHKVILFHRINGYLVILLSLTASAGALIIAQHAFGGDMATRTFVGTLVIATTVAYIFAWINIQRLQIDQHRAWMMRAWAYFSCIITLRIIMFSSAAIISSIGGFFTVRPCAQINFVLGKQGTLFFYPDCADFFTGDAQKQVIVAADFHSNNPIEIAASLGIPFGPAGWLAFFIHVVIIELYLRLTPAETDRLKQVSYERQLQKGYKHPGGAGLSSLRFGDANAFVPLEQRKRGGDGEEIGMLDGSGKNTVDDQDEH